MSRFAERVRAFVHLVEAGRGVTAMERYYADDVTMGADGHPPRVGRDTCISDGTRDDAVRSGVRTQAVAVTCDADAERSVVHWEISWTTPNGTRMQMEEVSVQEWQHDRITSERFFPEDLTEA